MVRALSIEELEQLLPSSTREEANVKFLKKYTDWFNLHEHCQTQLDARFAKIYSSKVNKEFNNVPCLNGRSVFVLDEDEQKALNIATVSDDLTEHEYIKKLAEGKDASWFKDRLYTNIRPLYGCKYFVISNNPMDYIFCSTYQAFSSCFSINSSHTSKLGVISFARQPSMYISYFSNSLNYAKEEYAGLKIYPMKIAARAFLYLLKGSSIGIGKVYPKDFCSTLISNLKHLFADTVLKCNDNLGVESYSGELKYDYLYTFDKNLNTLEPYLDNLRRTSGSSLNPTSFSSGKFERLIDPCNTLKFDTSSNDNTNFYFSKTPLKNSASLSPSMSSMMEKYVSIAQLYPICKCCGTSINASSNTDLCNDCFKAKYFTCRCCGKVEENNNPLANKTKHLCQGCNEKYGICSYCGNVQEKKYLGATDGKCHSCRNITVRRCFICEGELAETETKVCKKCLTKLFNV